MARQLLRARETRRLDNPDDNRTPSQVAATDASAADWEVYAQSIITQLRRIMGTADWKDDPPTTLAYLLANLAVAGNFVWNEEISGLKNGVNLVFTTAYAFEVNSLRVYLNGQRLRAGAGNDFSVSESGGLGTGYDTLTFASPELAPLPGESVLADYVKDL